MRTIRFPIAALMGAVVVVALGLAALRNASDLWAGATFLVTCGVLCLAIVGAVCRTGTERAWWLGFALFGWGYLVLAFWSSFELPTTALLGALEAHWHPPNQGGGMGGGMGMMGGTGGMQSVFMLAGGFGGNAGPTPELPFSQIGHCLLALLAALIGGIFAVVLFGGRRQHEKDRQPEPQPAARSRRSRWLVPAAFCALSGFVFIVVAGLWASRSAPGLWAGSTFFATCGLLGILVLGAINGQGKQRQVWLGAALFGVGYMTLVFGRWVEDWGTLPTDHLLHAMKRRFPPIVSGEPSSSPDVVAANARIIEALELTVPMPFGEETPLEDVLKHIIAATPFPGGKSIPIYVDPIGLQAADKTMASTVRNVHLEGVPLKTTLRLLLDQLDLTYSIRNGFVQITSAENPVTPVYIDPFMIVGNCLLALLAAGLGALVAPLVPGGRRQSSSGSATASA